MNRALRLIKILPALTGALLLVNVSPAADSVSGLHYRAVTRGNPGEYEKFEKLPLEQIGARMIYSSLETLKGRAEKPNPELEKCSKSPKVSVAKITVSIRLFTSGFWSI